MKPAKSESVDDRVAKRSSNSSKPPSTTGKRFIATKTSAGRVDSPSATTRFQPSPSVGAAPGRLSGRRPSHAQTLGLPLVFCMVAMTIDAMPPIVPPPWASLKASPFFQASKFSLVSQTVALT